ncbi:hypothetical protein BU24DRAFT_471649 [Aaosphaeria arxii CBS 175.79]|uniref:Uncharacterized protein n=1 Tax=Aaosphaeria arxii CBS 175.79 TaxID=1450172 RepID=A0A6A5YCJ9_9PLEO|nr:uncharacterized protein BU24DRAFT_471649 [Aaosphaeria arxii CBS 175.79]KAF2022430.1 hypothetical protein BU24DRAFT_471649 [Aaosphaeria arxii CBS 175.79]
MASQAQAVTSKSQKPVTKRRLRVGDPATSTVKIGHNYDTKMPNPPKPSLLASSNISTVGAALFAIEKTTGMQPLPPPRVIQTTIPDGGATSMSTASAASLIRANNQQLYRSTTIQGKARKASEKHSRNPHLVDVESLSLQQRVELTAGNTIQVFIGDTWACNIPWLLFRAMSTKAREIEDSLHLVLRLPAGLSKNALLYIFEWLRDICTRKYFKIVRRDVLEQDVAICRISRMMGMMRYSQHVFNFYWAHFNNVLPNDDEIWTLEQMSATADRLGLEDDDALAFFGCAARGIARHMKSEQFSPVQAEQRLRSHPMMQQAVVRKLRPSRRSSRRHT